MIHCANMREINFYPVEGEIAYEADTGKIFVYHNQQYIELPTKADTTEASNETLDISKPYSVSAVVLLCAQAKLNVIIVV